MKTLCVILFFLFFEGLASSQEIYVVPNDNKLYRLNLDIHSSDGWWDGTFKKFTLNPGVFAFYIEAEFDTGDKETFKGDITLVR